MKKIRVGYLYEKEVVQIILDDGKGNVLDSIMMNDLQELLDSFKDRNEIKMITFEGAGKHFSFGASVDEHKKEAAANMLSAFHKLFYTLQELSIPTMAKVSGQCLGGGMELAIMCNFIYAEANAKFAQPEIILGVYPPPASIILAQKIGLAKAEELIITGSGITAQDAHKYNLVNEVFEDKKALDTGVLSFIEKQILPKSASSLKFAVKSVRINFNGILGNYLSVLEKMYVEELMNTHDANEGINAFIEKRIPKWKNY
jgi:cyclohexa-1,5-dienecarbonyl-CoA hydratase